MKSMWREFIKYAMPSVIGMMVSALYVVVDGIFVGRGIGPGALASINVALPVTTLMIAVTMMVSMGGATVTSIKFGEGKYEEGNNIFLESLFLIVIITGAVSIIGVTFPRQIAFMLGASEELAGGTAEYLYYYLIFGIGFSGSLSLSVFVRNDGNPNRAMISLIIGALTNVALDYVFIFIFDFGIAGAAVASGLGQLIGVFILIGHFVMKKGRLRLYLPNVKINELIRILKTGMPEFIVQISPAVSVFAFNQVIIKRIGEMGIAGFSIIGYISTVLLALFMGISQGIQPLLSYNYGKGDFEKADKVFKMGMKSNFAASLIIYLVILLGGDNIIAIFGGDKALVKFTYDAIVIYAFSFVIASINIVTVTYYQSTENSKMANIISASRGIVFTLFFLAITPFLIGDLGIWVSIILSEASTLTLIAWLRGRNTLQNDMKYGSGVSMKEFIS